MLRDALINVFFLFCQFCVALSDLYDLFNFFFYFLFFSIRTFTRSQTFVKLVFLKKNKVDFIDCLMQFNIHLRILTKEDLSLQIYGIMKILQPIFKNKMEKTSTLLKKT